MLATRRGVDTWLIGVASVLVLIGVLVRTVYLFGSPAKTPEQFNLVWLGEIENVIQSVVVTANRIEFIDSSDQMLAVLCTDQAGQLRGGLASEGNVTPDCQTCPILGDSDSQLQLSVWDELAIVYVSVGSDNQPGVATVDDDGNGGIDNFSELGATGSDDMMLTPDDPGYADAAASRIVVAPLSRGAMRRLDLDSSDLHRVISAGTQIRIDVIRDNRTLASRIVDIGKLVAK